MGSTGDKKTILCLHGYLQNAESFRVRIGSMRKVLKSRAEFVFIDGYYEADDQGGRSWWQVQEGSRPSGSCEYGGWEASFLAIIKGFREHKIDGILGFSQGATATALFMAGLHLAHAQRQHLDVRMPSFAILISAFLPRDEAYAKQLQEARLSVPSLFVYGAADKLVQPERTLQLIDTFDSDSITGWQHAGAHLVPSCSGDFKKRIIDFLDDHPKTERHAPSP